MSKPSIGHVTHRLAPASTGESDAGASAVASRRPVASAGPGATRVARSPDSASARPRAQGPARPAAGGGAEVDAQRRAFDTVVRQVVLPALRTVAVHVDQENAAALDWLASHLQAFETSADAEAADEHALKRLAQLESDAARADLTRFISLIDDGFDRATTALLPPAERAQSPRCVELTLALATLRAGWAAWLSGSQGGATALARSPSINHFLQTRLVPAALARRQLITALHALRSACQDESPALGIDLERELAARLPHEYRLCDYEMVCMEERDAVFEAADRLDVYVETGQSAPDGPPFASDVSLLDAAARKRCDMAEFARWVTGSTPQDNAQQLAFLHMSVVRNLAVAAMTHADLVYLCVVMNTGSSGAMDTDDVAVLEDVAMKGKRLADQINFLTDADDESPVIRPLVAILASEGGRCLETVKLIGEWLNPSDAPAGNDTDELEELKHALDQFANTFRPLVAALAKILPDGAGTPALDDDLRKDFERVVQRALQARPREIDELLIAAKAARADRIATELTLAVVGAATSAGEVKAGSGKKSRPGRKTKRLAAPPPPPGHVAAPAPRAETAPTAPSPAMARQTHRRARVAMAVALESARTDGRPTEHTEALKSEARKLGDWLAPPGLDRSVVPQRAMLEADLSLMGRTSDWIRLYFKTQRLKNGPTRELFEDAELRERIQVLPGLDRRLLPSVSAAGRQRDEGDRIIEVALTLQQEPPPIPEPGAAREQEVIRFWLHVHVNANRTQMRTAHFKTDMGRRLAFHIAPSGEKVAVHRGFITPDLANEIMKKAGAG